MPIISWKDVVNKGKCLLGGRIKKDMTLAEALEVYSCVLIDLEKNTDLSSVRLKDLGLDNTCKIKAKNLLSEIINKLVLADKAALDAFAGLQQSFINFTESTSQLKDEKVKTSDDPEETAGYLFEKIVSPQSGTVVMEDGKLNLMGFAPVGAVMMIDAGRISDFDGTGKGKSGTDVWGWALSNGQNGTRNRFGKFPRFVTVNGDAGTTAGANAVKLGAANVPSISLPVSGTIAEALDNVTPEMSFDIARINDGAGGSTLLLKQTQGHKGQQKMGNEPLNVKHSHGFNMTAKLENTNVTEIATLPEFIFELPIQRINP